MSKIKSKKIHHPSGVGRAHRCGLKVFRKTKSEVTQWLCCNQDPKKVTCKTCLRLLK